MRVPTSGEKRSIGGLILSLATVKSVDGCECGQLSSSHYCIAVEGEEGVVWIRSYHLISDTTTNNDRVHEIRSHGPSSTESIRYSSQDKPLPHNWPSTQLALQLGQCVYQGERLV